MRFPLAIFALAAALACAPRAPAAPALVLWAWERPEDLSSAPANVEVAAVEGFVQLSGDRIWARGRRFPLLTAPGARRIAVVHVQIDTSQPLKWTPELRARTASAVLAYATRPHFQAVQIDFEVPASDRQVLLDLAHDVRAGLAPGTPLSMNALASWCETENWIDAAPVDEIVPMVFRLGAGGAKLKAKIEAGGDFDDPRCRGAIGIATDTPLSSYPRDRRVYVFNPHSWTPAAIAGAIKDFDP